MNSSTTPEGAMGQRNRSAATAEPTAAYRPADPKRGQSFDERAARSGRTIQFKAGKHSGRLTPAEAEGLILALRQATTRAAAAEATAAADRAAGRSPTGGE